MLEKTPKTILAVGAHPDDIEFGCGGILLKEHAAGARIHLLVCSKGESGTNGTPEIRVAECEAAAGILGAELEMIDCGGDGKIESTRSNALKIAQIIREQKPDIVLGPTFTPNQHPDHVAVGEATREAARLARYGGLEDLADYDSHAIDSLFYYAITPGAEPREPATFVFDITRFQSSWEHLMSAHGSQMKTRRYLDLQISRARTLGLQSGCEYAQALWSNDSVLVENLNSVSKGVRLF